MKQRRSRVPLLILVVLLGAAAVALLYGSVARNLRSGEPAAAPAAEPVTEAAATAAAEPTTEAVTEAAAEAATEPAAEAATEPTTEAATEPATEPTTGPAVISLTPEELARPPEDDGVWNLALVSAAHPLPNDYAPELAEAEDGYLYDARAVGALLAMLDGAREAGLSPMICSAYRPQAKQLALYEEKVNELILAGYSRPDAEVITKTAIAYPGTSEHGLGLAADIVAAYYDTLDRTQADTAEAIWLAEHCQEYGFILRYPEDKAELTGIMYEPWHFRYVGKEAAAEIMERGICLEEYLG